MFMSFLCNAFHHALCKKKKIIDHICNVKKPDVPQRGLCISRDKDE